MKAAVIEAALASGKLPPAAAAAAVVPGTNLRAALEQLGTTAVLRHPAEVIAFCDEEGLRWGPANLPRNSAWGETPSWTVFLR